MYSIIFFGSFQHYSVHALDKFANDPNIKINAVITTPPRKGDRGAITKTAVHEYCEKNNLPVFAPETLESIPTEIEKPDFLLVCGYGMLIPSSWLSFPRHMAINIHQSLLPDYAGRFPAEWAILKGETKTGVTMIQMSDKFDRGGILAQKSFGVESADTRDTLYTKLYELSAALASETLPKIIKGEIAPTPQISKGFYARQLTRGDGFVDPSKFTDPAFGPTLDRMLRALLPWPGIWTYITDQKSNRLVLKILSADISPTKIELKNVQVEGKKVTSWSEISRYYSLR